MLEIKDLVRKRKEYRPYETYARYTGDNLQEMIEWIEKQGPNTLVLLSPEGGKVLLVSAESRREIDAEWKIVTVGSWVSCYVGDFNTLPYTHSDDYIKEHLEEKS